MRVKKETGWTVSGSPGAYVVNDLGSGLQTRTYYDGQMPVEEDEGPRGESVAKWTRNFVGARGIEAMLSFDGSVTSTAFPLYDCHGNMVATVARSGGGFVTGNVRTYDVWGGVRSGASTGGPRGRYVANLGHVVDDESGLIYMRARYYEPGSGRFLSEDPAGDGENWFAYCSNQPITNCDQSGKFNSIDFLVYISGTLSMLIGMILLGISFNMDRALDVLNRQWLDAVHRMEFSRGNTLVRDSMGRYFEAHSDMKVLGREIKALGERRDSYRRGGGRALGAGIVALIGYQFLLRGLLDDIDLVGTEFDITTTAFGY